MSYLAMTECIPGIGCELKIVSRSNGNDRLIRSLGGLGCAVGKRDLDISHELWTVDSYDQISGIVDDFRSKHTLVDEITTRPMTEDESGSTFTEADLPQEDLRYRRAAEFLGGKGSLNVDRGMLLQALMDGEPDFDAFLADQESTIAS